MLDIIKRKLDKGTEERDGVTLVEMAVVVAAMAAFASIYAFMVIGAMMSGP